MSEFDLRALVREAVARHMGRPQAEPVLVPARPEAASAAGPHPSHGVYIELVNTSDACVIEPGVACNHCNYCRSHGH